MHASKFTKFKFIVRNASPQYFQAFDFIYPHNSILLFANPQIYVAADKNKIYSPVLLWNDAYFYEVVPTLTKQSPIGKQNL